MDRRVILFSGFWGNSILFSSMDAPVCIPTNSARKGFPFLHILANTYCFLCFDFSHSDRGDFDFWFLICIPLMMSDIEHLHVWTNDFWVFLFLFLHGRFFFFNVYLFLTDRKRQSASRGGTERGGDTESEASSRLWAVSTEPVVGLEPTNHEIMTWAKVEHLTDWATQAPQYACKCWTAFSG